MHVCTQCKPYVVQPQIVMSVALHIHKIKQTHPIYCCICKMEEHVWQWCDYKINRVCKPKHCWVAHASHSNARASLCVQIVPNHSYTKGTNVHRIIRFHTFSYIKTNNRHRPTGESTQLALIYFQTIKTLVPAVCFHLMNDCTIDNFMQWNIWFKWKLQF